jgi:predicted dehydrogenase
MFLERMKHFVAVVHGEAEPLCTLQDGIRAQQLIQAIHSSSMDGQLIEFV